MIPTVTTGTSLPLVGSALERGLRHVLEAEARTAARSGAANAPMRRREPRREPWHAFRDALRAVGLRPTRQRMMLGWILFSKGDRHVTADMIFEEAIGAEIPVSLGTVYNTLNQFSDAGLIRPVSVSGVKAFFDTNPSEHHHFFIPGEEVLVDIPPADVSVDRLPPIPDGFEVGRVEVVVRLRRKA